MVFSSHLFFFYFLPISLALYYLMPRRGKHLLLTLLSYIFYGWANPLFSVLMFVSTVIDYIAGLQQTGQFSRAAWRRPVPVLAPIPERPYKKGRWYNWLLVPKIVSWIREDTPNRTRGQKVALLVSIVNNLLLLGFFKYFNFGVENFNAVMAALGLGGYVWENFIRVTLPLGISFYTFQTMSYSIDVYRGEARAIRNFTDFACYVAMFPQLVAGPIIRFQDVADQLEYRTYTLEKFSRGAAFIAMGLAKKVLLANAVAKVADTAFDASSIGMLDAWVGVTAYAFQIYFDFSAYSDMAIGLGLIFGFVFAKNFDSPYISHSITEFWRRWHLSLSTWLRDNLYIPLGGNRVTGARTYVNLAMVMLLGGMWHGASWNFIIWGGIHGGMLAFERTQGKESFYARLPGPLKVAITFVIVLFTWVFFRAKDLPAAVAYCASMLGMSTQSSAAGLLSGVLYQPYYLGAIVICAFIVWFTPQTWDWTRRITPVKAFAIVGLFLLSLMVLSTQSYNPFIYFIF
jgi:alginate O-acetyltransferase complex protein AlgI